MTKAPVKASARLGDENTYWKGDQIHLRRFGRFLQRHEMADGQEREK